MKKSEELIRAKLVEDLKNGRSTYKFFYKIARHYVNDSHLAEDVASESWITIYRKAGVYNKPINSSALLIEDDDFRAWSSKITANKAINLFRKIRAIQNNEILSGSLFNGKRLSLENVAGSERREDNSPSFIIGETEDYQIARERLTFYISKLTTKYRRLIELRYFKRKAYEEMAEQLGIPLGSVKSGIVHAKRHLMEKLKNDPFFCLELFEK